MRKTHLVYILLYVISLPLYAQTIWTGTPMTFTRNELVDEVNVPEQQDHITDNVWIAREVSGIHNAYLENSFDFNNSTLGVEWAIGATADGIENLIFNTWMNVNDNSFIPTINQNMVMHLIDEDIYIDVTFTYWQVFLLSSNDPNTPPPPSSAFTYIRSTNQNLSLNDVQKPNITIFPNPAQDIIQLKGITQAIEYRIYNLLGKEVLANTYQPHSTIDLSQLNKGVYFIKLKDQTTIKIIKR